MYPFITHNVDIIRISRGKNQSQYKKKNLPFMSHFRRKNIFKGTSNFFQV
jgi:hypothetical protein